MFWQYCADLTNNYTVYEVILKIPEGLRMLQSLTTLDSEISLILTIPVIQI